MKSICKAAAILLLALVLPVTAFAAEDCYPACYTFTPPEGFVPAEGETAMWVNEGGTANINIIVEENNGVNPYDLTEEDIADLRDTTAKVFTEGLAQYQAKVDSITAETTDRREMLRVRLESSYVMESVEIKSRQVQYIFFTKAHTIYVTGTVLSDFADADTLLAAFDTAAQALELQGELYNGPTDTGNPLVIWVVIGAILGGAGGLTVYLLQQRKKAAAQQAEEAK